MTIIIGVVLIVTGRHNTQKLNNIMGYTHYWTYKPDNIENTEELRKRFHAAVFIINHAYKRIKKNKFIHKGQAGGACDDVPCIIRGGLGEGRPMINESEVWFNGDGKTDMDHETFGIKWYSGSKSDGFGFCKTNRKPYDLLVCVSLIAFKEFFDNPEVFTFSSDGGNEDWETAKDLYTHITGSFVGDIF